MSGRRNVRMIAALSMIASACRTPATEVVIEIATDIPTSRSTVFTVVASAGTMPGTSGARRWHYGAGVAASGETSISLPGSFAIVPRTPGGRDEVVTLTIEASVEGGTSREPAVTFRRRARFRFVEHVTTHIPITLPISCGALSSGCTTVPARECTVSLRCEELGSTCGALGSCAPIDIEPIPVIDDAGAPDANTIDASPEVFATSASPFGITTDSTSIYWTDGAGGSIWRMPLVAGAMPVAIAPVEPESFGVEFADGELYFAAGDGPGLRTTSSAGENTRVLAAILNTHYVAVDADNVYVTSDDPTVGGLYRIPRDGSPGAVLVANTQLQTLAMRAGRVYFAAYYDGIIGSIAPDGTGRHDLVTGEVGAWGLAVDDNYVYWANNTSGTVRRVPIAGGGPETLASATGGRPHGLLLDGDDLYWTDEGLQTISHLRLSDPSRTVVTLAHDQVMPRHLLLVGMYLYWTNQSGAVMRIRVR